MSKILKLTIVTALFALISGSYSKAAFPLFKKPKNEAVTTTLSANNNSAEKKLTAKQIKQENRALKKANKASGGKSKILAAVLAIFLGSFGVHSFYMGQTAKGFMQLGGTVLGIVLYAVGIAGYISGTGESFPILALIGAILILGVSVWAFIDFIMILTGGLEPEEGFSD